MRIEEITKEGLEKAPDNELLMLRLRFIQVWDKNFKNKIKKTVVGSLNRHEVLTKYRLLLKELQNRSLQHSTNDIDRQAFKKAMEVKKTGIDLDQFDCFTEKENYVFIDKAFKEEDEIRITIQCTEEVRNELLEEKIKKAFEVQVEKPCVFVYEENFTGEVIPLFHRILQPVNEIKKIKIVNESQEKEIEKKFEEPLSIIPITKGDERIVFGIVYEPDTVDAQGDAANAREIKKAAYQFMEEVQVFKVNHQGEEVAVRVLENYLAPANFTVGKKKVKKGSWVLVTRILDDDVWKAIKEGKLTGYSMAGYATAS